MPRNMSLFFILNVTDFKSAPAKYFLNEEIVNDYKLVKKLFKLDMKDIQSLKIDTDARLEFVRVYVITDKKRVGI